MLFDYSAGGLIRTKEMGEGTYLVAAPRDEKKATPHSSSINRIPARWREAEGPIGKAIREGKYDLLRSAINTVKSRSQF